MNMKKFCQVAVAIMIETAEKKCGNILVVDDNPVNIRPRPESRRR